MANVANADSLRRAVESRAGIITRRLAIDVDEDLHRAAHPHTQTGQLEGAIRVTHARTSPTTWRVTADVPVIQAATLDSGARPHVIRPRRAKALRFVMDGRVVFARVVNHPGNPPFRWFSRVLNPGHVRSLLQRFVGR